MKRIVKLTEQELKRIMRESVMMALQNENEREIVLAQKTLCKFPLSEVGLRLEGTKFYRQFQRLHDAIVELNNSLIKHIRRERDNVT